MVTVISRADIRRGDKEHSIWWETFEAEQREIEKRHNKDRLKFMQMLTKQIPNSKYSIGTEELYAYLTIPYPFFKFFRKTICEVSKQWCYDDILCV